MASVVLLQALSHPSPQITQEELIHLGGAPFRHPLFGKAPCFRGDPRVPSPFLRGWIGNGISEVSQTTGTPMFVFDGDTGGTTGTSPVRGSDTGGQRQGGTLRPCSGQSCARGTGQRCSVIYGGTYPEDSPSGNAPTSLS